jgi:endo-1,3(4)-beta-glucanase
MLTEDSSQWLVYITPRSGQSINLQIVSNTLVQATARFTGLIQVAKNPNGATSEALYDAAAGAYAYGVDISGSVDNRVGKYTLSWQRAVISTTAGPLLMFALPHHVQSFDSATFGAMRNIKLQTTTKGVASAVVKNAWTMQEGQLPTDMGFAPWSPTRRSIDTLPTSAVSAIRQVGPVELSQDIDGQTNLDSMYFSGKVGADLRQITMVR